MSCRPQLIRSRLRHALGVLVSLAGLVACSDGTTGPVQPFGSADALASISRGALVLHVDSRAAPDGDGSGRAPFATLGEAVAQANQEGGGTIIVAPGQYEVSRTVRIESPLTITGSNVMTLDAEGWPTGAVAPETETRIIATEQLGGGPLIMVSRTDGSVLTDVTIANVTLEGAAGPGSNLLIVKTQNFTVRDNVFTGPSFAGINTAASSGRVVGNYVTGVGCGICVGAGNSESPSTTAVKGNRVAGTRFGALLLNGSGTDVAEFADQNDVAVMGNDLSDNQGSTGTGFGIRVFIIRRDLGSLNSTQSTGHVRALIKGNRLVHNQIGFIIDAGFPYRRVGTVCDPRTYSGTIDVTLNENTIAGSTVTPSLITFTRVTAALNQSTLSAWQYVHDATYTITDPDGTLTGYWFDHPVRDEFVGPCSATQLPVVLSNHLAYNGTEISNGRIIP